MKWRNQNKFFICKMDWERIFFEFTIGAQEAENVSFAFMKLDKTTRVIVDGESVDGTLIAIKPESIEGRNFHFSINICAVSGRSFLENGEWRICAIIGDEVYPVSADYQIIYRRDALSRVFKYGKNKYAYNVTFGVRELVDQKIELILNSYFMIQNKTWKKRRYVQEALTFKGKCSRVYMAAVIYAIRVFYNILARITPKNGTRVLFMTETKDYLWGNLKYIYDRIIERGLDTQFKLRLSCRRAVGSHESITSWIRTIVLVAKSDYIFIDDYAPIFGFFQLYRKSTLVQVWHAGEGFKSVGYSRFGKAGSPFPMQSCHKNYTYALTGAENLRKVYEEVFGIERESILPLGMARLDGFLDETKISEFREKFYTEHAYLKDKKVILFAPTYRGAGQKQAYYDYDRIDLDKLYECCGTEYVVLFKMHPFILEHIQIPDKFRDRLYDFSSYPDINELYYITEILITDYSSNYYEYALMRKPILFYTYDREFYELARGVHRSVKEHAPGKVCDSFEELITALTEKDYEFEKTEQFVVDNFSEYDGKAADRIIDQILLHK